MRTTVIKGQARIRCDSVVDKAWEYMEGNQEEVMNVGECGGYTTGVDEKVKIMENKRK